MGLLATYVPPALPEWCRRWLHHIPTACRTMPYAQFDHSSNERSRRKITGLSCSPYHTQLASHASTIISHSSLCHRPQLPHNEGLPCVPHAAGAAGDRVCRHHGPRRPCCLQVSLPRHRHGGGDGPPCRWRGNQGRVPASQCCQGQGSPLLRCMQGCPQQGRSCTAGAALLLPPSRPPPPPPPKASGHITHGAAAAYHLMQSCTRMCVCT